MQDLPPGWNAERITKVIKHYDNQTEEEAVAEDESYLGTSNSTWMEIPLELVPAIRDILAKRAS